MAASRLSLALERGDVRLPEAGRIGVFLPSADADLSALPRDRVEIVQPDVVAHRQFAGQGYDCRVAPGGPYTLTLLFLPRAKELAYDMLAKASGLTDGPVVVDGAKTDGVESVLRAVRARVPVAAPLSKAHGKLFVIPPGASLADLAPPAGRGVEGFRTAPGVFSADRVDPGSRLLADALPARLGPRVVDLGAGWGFLSRAILERADVETLDLVEADHTALDCARANVTDPRARFHWDDATTWQPPSPVETVVTNPPFHQGRSASPELGRRFIANAAAMLTPGGDLYMVANRHLPYESALREGFAEVIELPGSGAFKLYRARRPRRGARGGRR